MFRFFRRRSYPTHADSLTLSAAQQQQLLDLLSEIGLHIVAEARGPLPLLTFGRRVLERLEVAPPIPLPHFSAALKHIIQSMDHERLRIMSPTDFLGVGYVYIADDPETWPVRTSR